ncbi:Gpr1 family protein [Mycena alexandri]|uniref:Gpr1 family protein n=1 Tax=Mycena alexandri TaxID=1745969 RepID=A0AAD6X235_9AGAR|nr:Gpr1 family protein [Mycena alexandri]KAJ7033787.1 Gpr1 family protein [Mycena alexandri]
MSSSTPEKGHSSHREIALEQGAIDTNEGPAHPSGISNPAPLGLISFASTTFIVSMYNVNARGITIPNVVVGMGIFTGGFTQFIAGMWEFPRGNVFGATAFSTYGAFWMAYATIFIPGSGILAAYDDPKELANALGIFLIAWFLVTVFFLLVVLRRNISFAVLLSSACVVFGCLAAGEFTQSLRVTKAGGVFGIITALVAFYVGLSEMMGAERRPLLRLPTGNL